MTGKMDYEKVYDNELRNKIRTFLLSAVSSVMDAKTQDDLDYASGDISNAKETLEELYAELEE